MKLEDLKTMGSFSEIEKVERKTVEMSIINMRYFADKIKKGFEFYQLNDKMEFAAQITFDGIKQNLNDYVQAFLDVVIVLCPGRIDSLRSAIRAFRSEFDLPYDLNRWTEFLIRRNDLIHDYFNYEFLNVELENALHNYLDCATELIDFLERELEAKNLMHREIRKK